MMANLIHFSQDGFQCALTRKGILLVDFWATWCGPCRMLAPVIEQLAADYDGRVTVGKVDVDEEPELARQYGIMSIPTVMLFVDGVPQSISSGSGTAQKLLVGLRPKETYEALLDAALRQQ